MKESKKIEKEVEEFLKAGGQIVILPAEKFRQRKRAGVRANDPGSFSDDRAFGATTEGR